MTKRWKFLFRHLSFAFILVIIWNAWTFRRTSTFIKKNSWSLFLSLLLWNWLWQRNDKRRKKKQLVRTTACLLCYLRIVYTKPQSSILLCFLTWFSTLFFLYLVWLLGYFLDFSVYRKRRTHSLKKFQHSHFFVFTPPLGIFMSQDTGLWRKLTSEKKNAKRWHWSTAHREKMCEKESKTLKRMKHKTTTHTDTH